MILVFAIKMNKIYNMMMDQTWQNKHTGFASTKVLQSDDLVIALGSRSAWYQHVQKHSKILAYTNDMASSKEPQIKNIFLGASKRGLACGVSAFSARGI